MTTIDHELQRLERDAIRTASRQGKAMAIYNLNRAGRRLLVIRAADSTGQEPYAGPFNPLPKWQAEFPDYPADAIPSLGDGWTDTSWQNEACPSFIHEESGVVLWCDYPAPEDRELGALASHYNLVQVATRDPVHGWQYGEGDSDVLRCDTPGELRDLLDHLATIPGATMADALLGARMRLNQLTADDARALIAENDAAPNPCPDLHAHCEGIIACADGLHSWIDEVGRLPADTRCNRCGEVYGDPE